MSIEDRTRHERLRALLPQAYATDPRDSALGVLLDVLGDGLRDLDQAAERALRDKWLATAEADRDPLDSLGTASTIELGGTPKPLEFLGAALDLLRQPWEVDEEAYRARVALLAPLLSHGLGTVRALLTFSITALGGEPCPKLTRAGDTTTAIGLAPGRHARCRECRAGGGALVGACPLRDEAIMTASLVENPRAIMRLSRQSLQPGNDGQATIRVESDSLFADRPELELRVPVINPQRFDEQYFDEAEFLDDDALVVPSFRSRRTSERIVIAQPLRSGDVLTILPISPHDPGIPDHLQKWVDHPPGSNRVTPVVRINGTEPDVPVILFTGVSFDGARFGDRFAPEDDLPQFDLGAYDEASFDEAGAPGTQEVTTPAVLPGIDIWDYVPLDRAGLEAARAAVSLDTPASLEMGDADTRPVSLRLRWWTRPATTAIVRIPLDDAVRRAIGLGAAEYVRALVDRVRPIGVTVAIEFVEPPYRESLEPIVGLRELGMTLVEPLLPLDATRFGPSLPAEALDGLDAVAFGGLFDVTPFDLSTFGTELVELAEALEPQARLGIIGLFDVVPFDLGTLAD